MTVWLFDLDNTLHHADAGIFNIINQAMTAYLAGRLNVAHAVASHIRQDYWHRYGATMAGLQIHHPEISIDEFLRECHPLDAVLPALVPVEGVAETLGRLNGRKAVLTNGPSFYAQALLEAMGLAEFFGHTVGTDDMGYRCKPDREAFVSACRMVGVARAQACILVDDSADNLNAAKKLGMKTVWFGQSAHDLPFVDFAAKDMAALTDWAEENGLAVPACG